jgi:dCMP deaminase
MPRISLDDYYAQMLALVASRSTCGRRQVAAILVDAQGILLSTGYNGVPRGMTHCIDTPCAGAGDASGNNERCAAIHAEQNCLLRAGDKLTQAHTLYVSTSPCFNCSKLIVSSGVKRVVQLSEYADQRGVELLVSAGVVVETLIVKPATPESMVREFMVKFGQYTSSAPTTDIPDVIKNLRAKLITEEAQELFVGMASNNLVEIADGAADLIYVVVGTCIAYGIPIDKILAEVHRSNMTKTAKPAKLGEKYGSGAKGPGYEPPRIAEILEAAK